MVTARLAICVLLALPFVSHAQDQGQMRFRAMDRNNDRVVTRAEWRGTDEEFLRHDWNNDGILSGEEVRADSYWTTGDETPAAVDGAAEEPNRGFLTTQQEGRFRDLDRNGDGRIEAREWRGTAQEFRMLDRNRDNAVTREEVIAAAAPAGARGTSGRAVPRGTSPPREAVGIQGNCVSSAAEVVDDVYQQVLERPADRSTAPLTEGLLAGRLSVRDVVRQVAKSDEHANRFFWHPVAARVYRRMLQRDPSTHELREIAAELSTRRSQLPDVVAHIADRAESNREDAVRLIYRGLLGRDADPEGLRVHTEMATRQGLEAVARAIVASPEYRQRTGSRAMLGEDAAAYEPIVQALYRHVLGRNPDPEGLRNFTQIAAVYGFDGVVDRMVASPEYDRMYGDDVVPGRNVRYCGSTP